MFFTQAQAGAIADALGETTIGLTGSEIGHLLQICGMSDPAAQATKRHRLLAAFAASQNTRGDRTAVLAFVRHSMKPERWLRDATRYEPLRATLNRALAFAGLACDMSLQEGGITVTAPAISMTAVDLVRMSGIPREVLAWAHSCHISDFACGQCRGCVKHYKTWEALGWDPH